MKRKLPIGIQTFREIREDNCYYVDKTPYIRRLLDEGKHYFLSRSAPVRQEPVRGYLEGTIRGQRAAVPRAGHSRWLGLVGAPSGDSAEFRQRPFPGPERSARQPDGATGAAGRTDGRWLCIRHRAGAFRRLDRETARAHRTTGSRSDRRVRQADPGCPGDARGRPRQPRLFARSVCHHQGQRRTPPLHLPHRRQQVLQGQYLLRLEQPL